MRIKPTQKQLNFLSWEVGAFFHFGIRSFFPGRSDWDGKPLPVSAFYPKELDCKQWIRVAKSAGARYAVLVCKHHDGFANWPTKYSDYSVAQSPWEDGKGDVVADFVKACRLYNVRVGLYYSPAQWGNAANFNNPKEYDDYFINQISELLTNYGKIDYLWFDGCGSEGHEYDQERIIKCIRDLQPDILIFNMWDPDTRWVGNEDGYADMPNVNERKGVAFSMRQTEDVGIDGYRYLPAECDMMMRSLWFDCEANEDTIKSVDELIGIYEYSVGRGANLLLNFGPDSRGLVPEPDAARAKEFGDEIRRRYENALKFTDAEQSGDCFNIHCDNEPWERDALVDTVVIEEDITEGEAVREFRILAFGGTMSICVYRGMNIGHKAICRFPAIRTYGLAVEIITAEGEVKLRSVKAYYVG